MTGGATQILTTLCGFVPGNVLANWKVFRPGESSSSRTVAVPASIWGTSWCHTGGEHWVRGRAGRSYVDRETSRDALEVVKLGMEVSYAERR